MKTIKPARSLVVALLPAVSLALGIILLATPEALAAESSWFVSFEGAYVAQNVKRSDVTQLVEVGTIQTDGFSELVFSFGGEFKERIPQGGTIGAILLPDEELVDYLLRAEGQFVFPLEVTFSVNGLSTHLFVSKQQTAKIGFPAYRVYLYNETDAGANVSLFVYRNRR
jgi:hypothetical protein